MKKLRVIPVLLLRNGYLVQSKGFNRYRNLGNPISAVNRLSEWASDELIYLDITKKASHDIPRNDHGYQGKSSINQIIEDVSARSFMPITIGGKIESRIDVEERLSRGADKITINSAAINDPNLISSLANEFGSQCIVISIDVKIVDGKYIVYGSGGTKPTEYQIDEWARIAEDKGAGELFINSIDRDGTYQGYDKRLLTTAVEAVNIPIIGCGGAGDWGHFVEAFEETGVDAVAAANIFHHMDNSVYLARKYLWERRCNVRPPQLLNIKDNEAK